MATQLEIVLKLRNEIGESLRKLRQDLDGIARQVERIGGTDNGLGQLPGNLRDISTSASEAQRSIAGISGVADTALGGVTRLVNGIRLLAAGFIALKSVQFLRDLAETAGRTEVLGTVLNAVGNNAGISVGKLREMDKAVQAMGITASASRQSLTQLIQAGLITAEQTEKAQELARASQDLAVISGRNSSETLQRMIVNIQQMDTVGLRHMGIMINMDQATEKYARSIGTTASALSQQQRQQAAMNAVLEEAAKLAGTYEASMGNASKQAASLARYQEQLKVSLGNNLLPAYLAVVEGITEVLKVTGLASDEMGKQGEIAVGLGNVLRGVFDVIVLGIKVANDLKFVLLPLVGLFALVNVKPGMTAVLGWFGLAKAGAQNLSFYLNTLKISLLSVGDAGIKMGERVARGAATASMALKAFGALSTSAFIGWEIGTFIGSFDWVKELALAVVTSVAVATEGVILGWDYMLTAATGKLKAWREMIKPGNRDTEVAAIEKETQARLDAILARAKTLNELQEDAWKDRGRTKLDEIVKQAENLAMAASTSRAKIAELGREMTELKALAAKGDPASLARMKEIEVEIQKLESRKKGQEKALAEFQKGLDATEKDAVVKATIDLTIDQKRIAKEVSEARTTLADAIKNGGFDKIKLVDDLKVSTQFAGVRAEYNKLLELFKKPVLGDLKTSADDVATSLFQLEQSLLVVAAAAKTPEELAIALRDVENTLQALPPSAAVLIQSLTQLKQNLTFQKEKAELEGMDTAAKSYSARLAEMTRAMQVQRDVQSTMTNSRQEFMSMLNDFGVGINRVTNLADLLSLSLSKMPASVKIQGNFEAQKILQDFAQVREAYERDLADFERLIGSKQMRIKTLGLTQSEVTKSLVTLDRTSLLQRIELSKKYFDDLTKLQQDSLGKFRGYADQIKAIEKEMLDTQRSRENDLRDVRRSYMTEEQIRMDKLKELETTKSQLTLAGYTKNHEEVKRLSAEQIALAKEMATDKNLPEWRRAEALKALKGAYDVLGISQKQQKDDASSAAKEQAAIYAKLSKDLSDLSTALGKMTGTIKLEMDKSVLEATKRELDFLLTAKVIPVTPEVNPAALADTKAKIESLAVDTKIEFKLEPTVDAAATTKAKADLDTFLGKSTEITLTPTVNKAALDASTAILQEVTNKDFSVVIVPAVDQGAVSQAQTVLAPLSTPTTVMFTPTIDQAAADLARTSVQSIANIDPSILLTPEVDQTAAETARQTLFSLASNSKVVLTPALDEQGKAAVQFEVLSLAKEQQVKYSPTLDPVMRQQIEDELARLGTGATVPIKPEVDALAMGVAKSTIATLGTETNVPVKVTPTVDPVEAKKAIQDPVQSVASGIKALIGVELDRGTLNNVVNQIKNALSNIVATVQVRTSGGGARYATGGYIRGPGTETSDSIFAMLSRGEYVLRASAVKTYGLGLLEEMNALRLAPHQLPRFATGGLVSSSPAPVASESQKRDIVDLNLNIGGKKMTLFGERDQVRNVVLALKQAGG